MNHPFLRPWLALILLVTAGSGQAAKAPMGEEEMRNEASLVVRATVLKATSKVQKSKIVRGLGINKDTVHTLTIRIEEISKGTGIQKGQEITVLAWDLHTRIPAIAGLQGHEFIPKKGEVATFYLKPLAKVNPKDKTTYEPLLPNGMVKGK
jgi:hypothetical protein